MKPEYAEKEPSKPNGPTQFSETEELQHERNEVASAQKQMSSQETAGVADQP
ncbi:hypothetical protein [Paenibacillus hamazuiensis]|uniref:hypothetical protein n=1 Tax=Paenibacillus hamazuiensis TaxID=2936508 RepID=UPI00200D2A07|nr:hypothetical protein [Paenibacillus hamazuiensis]